MQKDVSFAYPINLHKINVKDEWKVEHLRIAARFLF